MSYKFILRQGTLNKYSDIVAGQEHIIESHFMVNEKREEVYVDLTSRYVQSESAKENWGAWAMKKAEDICCPYIE